MYVLCLQYLRGLFERIILEIADLLLPNVQFNVNVKKIINVQNWSCDNFTYSEKLLGIASI